MDAVAKVCAPARQFHRIHNSHRNDLDMDNMPAHGPQVWHSHMEKGIVVAMQESTTQQYQLPSGAERKESKPWAGRLVQQLIRCPGHSHATLECLAQSPAPLLLSQLPVSGHPGRRQARAHVLASSVGDPDGPDGLGQAEARSVIRVSHLAGGMFGPLAAS